MIEKRILVLEDEILQAVDLSELLTSEGYHTKIADSYIKGVELIKSFNPHLVICDINLKESLTGVDFAKYLNNEFPSIQFIFITAITKSNIIEEARQTDPLNYIVKPWKQEQIIVSVLMAFNYILSKQKNYKLIEKLTLTEYKILKLITQQKSTREIASELFVSESTIKNHRHNIIQKLNIGNEKNSLLKWASQHADI